jgi:hypothetical protein
MKWKSFIVPVLLLALFISCKKNSSNSSASNSNKLKFYIEDATNTPLDEIDSFSFTYDGQNRITSLYSTNIRSVYAYPTSNTFTLDLFTYGTFNIHEVAYINSSSLVDSTFQYNNTNDTTTEGYIYSGRLLLVKTTYDYSAITGAQISMQDEYTYDNNGNAIKDVQTDGFGNVNTISTFTYTDKLLNYSIGPTYIPQSKNLPATLVQTDGSGSHIATITYTYVFDSSNRVIKETDAVDNGESVVKTYVYY